MGRHAGKTACIVGCGPVGLTTALLLAKRGCIVHVFEKRPMPDSSAVNQRSIIISLFERGVLALKEAGFEIPHKENGERWKNDVSVCKGVTAIFPKFGKPFVSDIATKIWLTERDSLSDAILAHAKSKHADRIHLHFSTNVSEIDFEKRKLKFASEKGKEEEVSYDLLVGADGANSSVRKELARFEDDLEFKVKETGLSWKGFTNLPRSEKLSVEDEQGTTAIFISLGIPRAGIWPTKNGAVAGVIQQPTAFFTKETNTVQNWEELMRKASPYFPEEWISETARQLEESPISHVRTAWCSKFYGPNTILLGDAANTVSPALGQGLNSALESCLIFAKELDLHDDIDTACREYGQKRLPELHALYTLDKEAPGRFGQYGIFSVGFIARSALQKLIWKWLYTSFPSKFSMPEQMAMTCGMRYTEVLRGYRRDDNIVRATLALCGFGLAVLAYKGVNRFMT